MNKCRGNKFKKQSLSEMKKTQKNITINILQDMRRYCNHRTRRDYQEKEQRTKASAPENERYHIRNEKKVSKRIEGKVEERGQRKQDGKLKREKIRRLIQEL